MLSVPLPPPLSLWPHYYHLHSHYPHNLYIIIITIIISYIFYTDTSKCRWQSSFPVTNEFLLTIVKRPISQNSGKLNVNYFLSLICVCLEFFPLFPVSSSLAPFFITLLIIVNIIDNNRSNDINSHKTCYVYELPFICSHRHENNQHFG